MYFVGMNVLVVLLPFDTFGMTGIDSCNGTLTQIHGRVNMMLQIHVCGILFYENVVS
jgi:hypothetical protein